jgi:hypothetical protein
MKSWTECEVETLLPGNVIAYEGDSYSVKGFPNIDKVAGRVIVELLGRGYVSFDENEEVEVYR